MKIIQVLNYMHYEDCIGNNALALKKLFNSMKIKNHIAALNKDANVKQKIISLKEENVNKDDIIFVHYAGWSPLIEEALPLKCKKILYYHNVTPGDFIAPYSKEIAEDLRFSKIKLKEILVLFDKILSVSRFNAADFNGFNYNVAPVLIDFKRLKLIDNKLKNIYKKDGIKLLFVSRVVPQKNIQDLIKAVKYIKDNHTKKIKLFIAGHNRTIPAYYDYLIKLISEEGLNKEIVFLGHLSRAALNYAFKKSDIYVSASLHEGFGQSFVEAMYFKKPIVCYNSAACAETLKDAGILIKPGDIKSFAQAVISLKNNSFLRKQTVKKGKKRLKDFSYKKVSEKIKEIIKNV